MTANCTIGIDYLQNLIQKNHQTHKDNFKFILVLFFLWVCDCQACRWLLAMKSTQKPNTYFQPSFPSTQTVHHFSLTLVEEINVYNVLPSISCFISNHVWTNSLAHCFSLQFSSELTPQYITTSIIKIKKYIKHFLVNILISHRFPRCRFLYVYISRLEILKG